MVGLWEVLVEEGKTEVNKSFGAAKTVALIGMIRAATNKLNWVPSLMEYVDAAFQQVRIYQRAIKEAVPMYRNWHGLRVMTIPQQLPSLVLIDTTD
jgi:hypothetical protein